MDLDIAEHCDSKRCDNPIFIVGAPRSGTTLLRSILDAHPSICCPNWETGVFDYFGQMIHGDYGKYHANDPSFPISRDGVIRWMRRCADDLMFQMVGKIGKPRWAEKTPAHVYQIDLIHEVYPKAQFLHIIRNGREVVKSLQNMHWAPRKIRWSIDRWVSSVKAGRSLGAKLPANQYYEIKYEHLISDTARSLQDLCDFLGEPYTSALLNFYRPENNSWQATYEAIKKSPINNHKHLSLFERAYFSVFAGPMQRGLGYQ